jgi:hypothetical protein
MARLLPSIVTPLWLAIIALVMIVARPPIAGIIAIAVGAPVAS